jgi:hypothetical protein
MSDVVPAACVRTHRLPSHHSTAQSAASQRAVARALALR